MPNKDPEKRKETARKWAKKNKNKERKIRYCTMCNEEIKNKNIKYCSKECKDNRDFTVRRGPLNKLICEASNCDNIFYTRGSVRRFCSIICNKREGNRRRSQALKEQLYQVFGNKCVCCGESKREFLTLEHKRANGAEHRRNTSHTHNVWKDAIESADPYEYEILCMNCNWSKGKFGYCPHELEREV